MDVYEAIKSRRDTRHFTAESLPKEVLERALHAAISGPSVGLSQPWRFLDMSDMNRQLLIDNFTQMRQQAESSIEVEERRQLHQQLKLEGLREAPTLLACFCAYPEPTEYTLGMIGNPRSLEWSCACAIQNLWLALTAEGFGVGWVTILDLKVLAASLHVPTHWEPLGVLCMGRPASDYGGVPMLEKEHWKQAERSLEHFYFQANI